MVYGTTKLVFWMTKFGPCLSAQSRDHIHSSKSSIRATLARNRTQFCTSVSEFFKIVAEAKSLDLAGSANYVKVTWFTIGKWIKDFFLTIRDRCFSPQWISDACIACTRNSCSARDFSRTRTGARLESRLVIGWIWRSFYLSANYPRTFRCKIIVDFNYF